MKYWIRARIAAKHGLPPPPEPPKRAAFCRWPRPRKRPSRAFPHSIRYDARLVRPPDLDLMPAAELCRLATRRASHTLDAPAVALKKLADPWMRELFPTRPRGFQRAALAFRRLAQLLRAGKGDSEEFEELYQGLPAYAQWRRWYVIPAATVPGEEFQPKPKRWRSQLIKLSPMGKKKGRPRL